MAERREETLLTNRKFLFRKRGEIAARRRDDRRRRRVIRLNDHLSRKLRPSRAPRHLRKQLERPLGRAEVWHVKRTIGIEDANERDIREVEPLRNHLRAEKDIRLAAPERGKNVVVRVLARCRVCVHAENLRIGEALRKRGLRTLGADALVLKRRRAARGADLRRKNPPAADMAAATVIGAVIRIGKRTFRAVDRRATDGARHAARIATAIQEEYRLLVAVKPELHGIEKIPREDRARGIAALRR